MALNQMNLKGRMIALGTLADILAAESAGQLIVGREYQTNDQTEQRSGRAVLVNKIEWDVTSSFVTGLVTAEATAREAADVVLQNAINTEAAARIAADAAEVTARQAADATLQNAITAEATARQAADATLQSAINTEVADRIAAVSAEATARQAADTALQNAINTEVANRTAAVATEAAARQAADLQLANALNTEIAAREAGDIAEGNARTSAINAVQTALTALINSTAEQLRDTTVADIIPVVYSNGDSLTLSSILGANRPDGIYAVRFASTDLQNTATVTGLPASDPGTGDITFGDTLRVVINGGVVTSAVKMDDITKAKFSALDSQIQLLLDATTASAIRSHFSPGSFITVVGGVISVRRSASVSNDLVDSNGDLFIDVDMTETVAGGSSKTLNQHFVDLYAGLETITQNGAFGAVNGTNKNGSNVELGGALNKNTSITGAFDLSLDSQMTKVSSLKMPIWSVNPDGSRNAKTASMVEVWFDGNSINYIFPN